MKQTNKMKTLKKLESMAQTFADELETAQYDADTPLESLAYEHMLQGFTCNVLNNLTVQINLTDEPNGRKNATKNK